MSNENLHVKKRHLVTKSNITLDYFFLFFIESDNEETAWMQDLIESKGKEACQKEALTVLSFCT